MEKSVDRISQLPEPVICEILSWLPIRDSIATCFLSRSWRHRWEDLQAFNFSTLPFLNQEDFLDEQGRTRFHAFVNGVRLHHRSSTTVRKLIIHHHKFNPHFDGAALKAWFRAAIGPHLEELKLKLEGWKFMVPSRLFTCCTSLVNLQLSYCFRAERLTQNKVRFPSLKNLKLGSCNPKLVNKILSPILETLDLRAGRGIRALKIHSPSLKRLYFDDSYSRRTELVEIDTPLLEYLSIRNICNLRYRLITVCNSHNLVEANIDCCLAENPYFANYVPQLLKSLCNVKSSLVLHPETIYVM